MFPKALEYGMTPKQYWEEDEDLFIGYQKAYINKIHTNAHIQGLYIFDALTIVANNIAMAFSKDKQKPKMYHETAIYNPFNVGTDKISSKEQKPQKTTLEKQLEEDLKYRKKLMQWI